MEVLLKKWKSCLGAGGTAKDTSVEVQGDHCKELIADLKKRGYAAMRCGGRADKRARLLLFSCYSP